MDCSSDMGNMHISKNWFGINAAAGIWVSQHGTWTHIDNQIGYHPNIVSLQVLNLWTYMHYF